MMQHCSLKILRNIPKNLELLRKVNITSDNQFLFTKTCLRSFSKMATSKRVAVCQMTAVGDKNKNLDIVSQLVDDAAKENVQMVFFPECCDFIFANKQETLREAEPILGGALVNAYRELAKKHNVWLSLGGLHEKDASDPLKIYNTHLILDNRGSIVQAYRKLHLFDVEIPEKKVRLKESDFVNGGSNIVTPVASPVGKIGLSICYDMRFPELSTQLAMMGADILTFPSAFTVPTGKAHWEVLLRARAIENQCYVIAAAQFGDHNEKRRSYGHAIIVDPWGAIVADCGEQSPSYKVAEIEENLLANTRRNMPVFQHRRKNVYSLYCLSLRKNLLPIHAEFSAPPSADSRQTTEEPCNAFGHVRVPESCVFYRSDLTFAFVNLRCVIPGHVLIAPIRVAERNNDLTDEEATDFYRTVRLVQRLMETVHNTNSCTVTIQDGEDAGQTVKHLHCHIMPRKKGDFIENDHIYLELAKNDQLTAGHPSKPARTIQEMQEEAAFLRKQLNNIISSQKN